MRQFLQNEMKRIFFLTGTYLKWLGSTYIACMNYVYRHMRNKAVHSNNLKPNLLPRTLNLVGMRKQLNSEELFRHCIYILYIYSIYTIQYIYSIYTIQYIYRLYTVIYRMTKSFETLNANI